MLKYRLNLKTELFFGENQIENLPKILKKANASKILMVYGSKSIKQIGLYEKITTILSENKIVFEELPGIEPNPKLSSVKSGAEICKEKNIDFILAVGGGSVIDASKAIAASRYYSGNPWDFFEKKANIKKALPIGVVLTHSATGSEMNAGMVITNEETKEKLDWGSLKLIPQFAILDPTYTFSVSKFQTACGIADIMSHVFEQYFSFPAEAFLQDRFSEAILKTCIFYGKRAVDNPTDEEARENIMQSATMALNGLIGAGKQGDWATHFIEHEISAINDMTHGAGLAILTPNWMKKVLDENSMEKFYEYGKNVWNLDGSKEEVAKKSIEKTAEFFKSLGLPQHLKDFQIIESDFEKIADNALNHRKIGRFKKLSKEDIIDILRDSF